MGCLRRVGRERRAPRSSSGRIVGLAALDPPSVFFPFIHTSPIGAQGGTISQDRESISGVERRTGVQARSRSSFRRRDSRRFSAFFLPFSRRPARIAGMSASWPGGGNSSGSRSNGGLGSLYGIAEA